MYGKRSGICPHFDRLRHESGRRRSNLHAEPDYLRCMYSISSTNLEPQDRIRCVVELDLGVVIISNMWKRTNVPSNADLRWFGAQRGFLSNVFNPLKFDVMNGKMAVLAGG